MVENKRRVAFGLSGNKKKNFGPGKLKDLAVEVVSYDVSSKDSSEHSMIVKTIADVIDNDGKVVIEKGVEIQTFMPPEKVNVDGKLVVREVKSRRDVQGLKGKTSMAYGTGDAMAVGSIINLSKAWVSNVDGKPVLNANYGAGLFHKDALKMNYKTEDGEFEVQTGVAFGSDAIVSVKGPKVKENSNGEKYTTQNAQIVLNKEAVTVDGLDGIAKVIDKALVDERAMGSAGAMILLYKKPKEGENPEEVAANFENRMSYPIFAYAQKPEVEGGEYGEPSGEYAVKSGLVDSTIQYAQDVLKNIESGEWDIVVAPAFNVALAPSLVAGNKKMNEKDAGKVNPNLQEQYIVLIADEKLDKDGNQVMNKNGFPVYENAAQLETGFRDINVLTMQRNVEYFHENGNKLSPQELKISWKDKAELIAEGGKVVPTNSTMITKISLLGDNYHPHRAYPVSDILTNETPEYMAQAIEVERGKLNGMAIAYYSERKAERDGVEQEGPEHEEDEPEQEVPATTQRKPSSPSMG